MNYASPEAKAAAVTSALALTLASVASVFGVLAIEEGHGQAVEVTFLFIFVVSFFGSFPWFVVAAFRGKRAQPAALRASLARVLHRK